MTVLLAYRQVVLSLTTVSQRRYSSPATLTAATACCRAPVVHLRDNLAQRSNAVAIHFYYPVKSGVTLVIEDAMAVHRHEEGCTSSPMSISTVESMTTIDCSRKRIHSETGKCFFMLCSVYENMISPLLPVGQCFNVNMLYQTLYCTAVQVVSQ